ncbi:MAG: dCTP deaminase [Candidatus Bathyarchaeia archaeon]|nr:dCTP deaminase [Candidatus Bathyarchaeota archaeon]
MALSDTTIRRLVAEGKLKIDPFDEGNLNPAGYDLRSAGEVVLEPGQHGLTSTLEWISLPPDLLGILHVRSSFAREGLFASLALVDPGFRGQLTVSIFNAGKGLLRIGCRERFIQLTLVQLSGEAERPYEGRYQDSSGVIESRRGLRLPVSLWKELYSLMLKL